MTVCAAEKCKTYANVGEENVRRPVYSQICHNHCFLSEVSIETMNNESSFLIVRQWSMVTAAIVLTATVSICISPTKLLS